MPSYVISEYASGQVIFSAREETGAKIADLEPYIQAYKKISRVENQFIVRHANGLQTDTAGHAVSKEKSPLLFELYVEHKGDKITLSADASSNTPEARLALNQLKAYALSLNLWSKSLFTYKRIVPKIKLEGPASDAIQKGYDLEKLEYSARYKKREHKRAALKMLEGLGLILVAAAVLASLVMLITPPVSILVGAFVLAPVIALSAVSSLVGVGRFCMGLIDLAIPLGLSQTAILSEYNGHFGALCAATKNKENPAPVVPGVAVIFHTKEAEQASKASPEVQVTEVTSPPVEPPKNSI